MAKKVPKMTFSLSPVRQALNTRRAYGARMGAGARGKEASSPHVPTPASHPLAPWSPQGATTVPKFFVLGIFELRTVVGSTNLW